MTLFFVSALAAFAAVSRAAPLAARDNCASVPPINTAIETQIYNVALSMNVNDNVMLAMFCTAIQESNINNLDCGDKQSHGVFQQQAPGFGWGTVAQTMDVDFSTRSFLNVAIAIDKQTPGLDAGVLAQMTQQAEAGNQYTQHEAQARQIIAAQAAAAGGKKPTSAAPPPASSSSKPAATSSKPVATSSQPAATSSSGAGGAVNVAPAPTPSATAASTSSAAAASSTSSLTGCAKSYRPQPGDSCLSVSAQFGISLDTFYDMNPSISRDNCPNLEVSQDYCVQPGASSSASVTAVSTASGAVNVAPAPSVTATATASSEPESSEPEDGEDDCVNLYVPVAGDTCMGVAAAHGISLAHFYDLNPCIDSATCSNLEVGEAYCVDKPASS